MGCGRAGRWWPREAGLFRIGGVLALALSVLPIVGLAQQPRRYSGKVQRVELGEGLVVVEELGEKGRPQRHEVYVTMETPIVSAQRLRPRDMRSPNAYGEIPVSLVDLLTGDFVVVESVEAGGRTVALRITIVESSDLPRRAP